MWKDQKVVGDKHFLRPRRSKCCACLCRLLCSAERWRHFPFADTNRKVWLARLNEGTWFKTLWTVTATYAMLHAQLSYSLFLLYKQRPTSQSPASYTGSSPAEKGGFLQGRSLGTRLSMAMKSLIITMYLSQTNGGVHQITSSTIS